MLPLGPALGWGRGWDPHGGCSGVSVGLHGGSCSGAAARAALGEQWGLWGSDGAPVGFAVGLRWRAPVCPPAEDPRQGAAPVALRDTPIPVWGAGLPAPLTGSCGLPGAGSRAPRAAGVGSRAGAGRSPPGAFPGPQVLGPEGVKVSRETAPPRDGKSIRERGNTGTAQHTRSWCAQPGPGVLLGAQHPRAGCAQPAGTAGCRTPK